MPSTFQKWGSMSYIVDRPLGDQEIDDQLRQNLPSLSVPWCHLSVIRMNSTYLECVDQYHSRRGMAVAGGLLGLICFSYMIINVNIFIYKFSQESGHSTDLLGWLIPNLILGIPTLAVFLAFGLECFRFTHYPIRFNRKTGMVHVFRRNGTVMSEHWNKLFFTPSYRHDMNWEVRGHCMEGSIVRETFVLPLWTSRDDDGPNPCMYSLWEFIRRYMEDGPEKLVYQVEYTMNVQGKRETYSEGLMCLMTSFQDSPVFMIMLMPLILLGSIGRVIVSMTCKIPVWPEEIEKTCEFSSDDPYIRDEYHLALPGSAVLPQWGHPEP